MCSFDLKTAVFLMIVAVLTLRTATAAETDPKPLVMTGGVQVDDDGSTDFLAGLDYQVARNTWLSGYVGYTEASDDVSDVNFTTALAGLDHAFGKIGLSGSVQQWGDPDVLDSIDIRGQLYFKSGGFRAALIGERRNIDFTLQRLDDQLRPFERVERSNADALGLSLRYSGERVTVYGSHLDYDYDFDIEVDNLTDLLIIRLLNSSAVTLANSFVDDSTSVGLDVEFGDKILNVEVATFTGVTDGEDTHSASTAFLFPVHDRVDLEVRVGVSDADDLDSVLFGGLTFFVYR